MGKLTHLDESGAARMVDVTSKPASERVAVAQAHISMREETLRLLLRTRPHAALISLPHLAFV